MKKRKSIAARLGVAAMALTLITTSLSSGTLAKFAETVKASGTFTVAKWNVGAKAGASGSTQQMTATGLSLGDLAKFTANSYPTTGVASGVIAPGMSGGFQIDVGSALGTNGGTTQTAFSWTVWVKGSTGDLPTNFKMKNGSTEIKFQTSGDPTYDSQKKMWKLATGNVAANTSFTKSVQVEWEWALNDNDASNSQDTTDAGTINGASTTFDFVVEFEQIDPTSSTTTTE